MTQSKAQTVASAAIGAGYLVTLQRLGPDSYVLLVEGSDIDPAAVASFATAQAITATVTKVRLI